MPILESSRLSLWDTLCLSLHSVAVIDHHDQKELGEARVYLAHVSCPITVLHEGKSSVELKARTEVETMEERCLPAC